MSEVERSLGQLSLQSAAEVAQAEQAAACKVPKERLRHLRLDRLNHLSQQHFGGSKNMGLDTAVSTLAREGLTYKHLHKADLQRMLTREKQSYTSRATYTTLLIQLGLTQAPLAKYCKTQTTVHEELTLAFENGGNNLVSCWISACCLGSSPITISKTCLFCCTETGQI